MSTEETDFNPRERGVFMGGRWAAMAVESRRVDPRDLQPIAEGHVDDSTREAVTALLVFQIDREDNEQFWGGFCHGVAGYLVERHGLVESSRKN